MLNKNTNIHSLFIITIAAFSWFQCNNDKLVVVEDSGVCTDIAVSYELNIKKVIDNNCALGGCHVSGGDGPGNYTMYQNILPYIQDGSFKRTVIDLKDDPNIGMPPDWSTNGSPLDLSSEDLELVKCWAEKNYPEF